MVLIYQHCYCLLHLKLYSLYISYAVWDRTVV
uniref:Uncharacterized protein n=1 Tax=Arundo donax TaxID=35708 RepID=A0A0A9BBI0_ARUDO